MTDQPAPEPTLGGLVATTTVRLPSYRCSVCGWGDAPGSFGRAPIVVRVDGAESRHCPECYVAWVGRQVRANVPEIEQVDP